MDDPTAAKRARPSFRTALANANLDRSGAPVIVLAMIFAARRDGPFEMTGIQHAPVGSTSRLGAFAKLGTWSSRSLRGYLAGGRGREFPDANRSKTG
jgi:hypothetical protein